MDTNTWIEQFENHLRDMDMADLTVHSYCADMRLFIRWFEQTNGEPFAPQAVTPTALRQYRQYLLTVEERMASTINHRMSAITAFMNWTQQSDLVEQHPVQGIGSLAQASSGPKYLTKQQILALQQAIEKDLQLAKLRYPRRWLSRQRDGSLAMLLLHTGLRLQEALDLQMNDVQMSEDKGVVLVRRRNGRGKRAVPLNAEARNALQDWLAVRPQSAAGFLWLTVEGDSDGVLSSRSVQRTLRRMAQDAGIDHLTPQMLRHSFARNLMENGVGLEKIAALLGQANLNTTRIYITLNPDDLVKVVEELSKQQG